MSSRRIHRCITGVVALWACAAFAQVQDIPGFELERLQLNPGARDSLVLSTGDLLQEGHYRVALTAHYEHNPLVLYETDAPPSVVVAARLTAHLSGAYAIKDWLELGAQVPLMGQWSAGNVAELGLSQPAPLALGTPWVQVRAGLLSELKGDALDLGVQLGAALPLGNPAALTRDQGFVFAPRLGIGKRFAESWRVGADVGVLVRTKSYALSPDIEDPTDVLGSELSGGLNLTRAFQSVTGELVARGTRPLASSPASMEVLLGLRVPLGRVELYAMGGPGFGRTPGTPAFRVLAGIALVPPPPSRCVEGEPYAPADCPDLDADGDKVKNGVDRCPREPGPAANDGCPDRDSDGDSIIDRLDACPHEKGSVENKGCPDKDTDGDGLIDREDACPKEKGPAENKGCPDKDSDEDGVVDRLDACPQEKGAAENKGCPELDSDGDGLLDSQDACPQEKGPVENKGCPDKDSDGDGLIDRLDACPFEKGPADNKGCPDRDTDGDGLLDRIDACPTVAGPPENKGCPDTDRDGDTVVDRLDNCPDEKGTVKNHGCKEKQLATLEASGIRILDSVYFELNKDVIQPRSFKLLDNVASIVSSHPEILKLRVEGHTDDLGDANYNMELSQHRAESVVRYLVGKGVTRDRLEPRGFGKTQPVAENRTLAGQAKNRRVEFKIVNVEGAQP